MTSPLPEARPLAWTARRLTELERYEGRLPPPASPPRRGWRLGPLAPVARLLRGG